MRTFDPDEYERWLERFKRKKAYSWQTQKPPVVLWSSVPERQQRFVQWETRRRLKPLGESTAPQILREPVEEEKCCAALPYGDCYAPFRKQAYRRCEAPRGKGSPFCQAHERMVAARGMRKEE